MVGISWMARLRGRYRLRMESDEGGNLKGCMILLKGRKEGNFCEGIVRLPYRNMHFGALWK